MRFTLALATLTATAPALATAALAQTATPPAGATATAGPVVAAESACLSRLQQAVPVLQESLDAANRRELRQLRDTAVVFAQRGNEDLCRAMVVEIERMAGTAPVAGDAAAPVRRERAATAQPMSAGYLLHFDSLLDADIVGTEGDYLGEVTDIVMVNAGEPRYYALVDRDDNWFSIGGDQVAVPLGALRATDDDTFVLGMTEDAFDELPALDGDDHAGIAAYDEVDRQWAQ